MSGSLPSARPDQTSTDLVGAHAASPAITLAAVPTSLREFDQWVCWRYVLAKGKANKCPFSPRTGQLASSTDPSTWTSFHEATRAWESGEYEGVGFVFGQDDPFTGVDLDECLDARGELVPSAREIIAALDSYSEFSPSGRGVKIFLAGCKPSWAKCRSKKISGFKEIEIYSKGRFFTVTGRHMPGTRLDVESRQGELDQLCERLWSPSPPTRASAALAAPALTLDDDELIRRACKAQNGERFKRLWDGDTSMHAGDDSAADLALCNLLAFWTGRDPARMDLLFRRSGLYREKWERRDYREVTIRTAIESCDRVYAPGRMLTARAEHDDGTGEFVAAHTSQNKPSIVLSVHEHEVIDAAIDALASDPELFARGTTLVRVIRAHQLESRAMRRAGTLIIASVPSAHLRERLTRCAKILGENRKQEDCEATLTPKHPPQWLVAAIEARGRWPALRELMGIAESPFLRHDGSVCQTPGYDETTGVLYHPTVAFEPVPEAPTRDDASKAVAALRDLVCDFRFEAEHHFSAWLAALLTTLGRHAFHGPSPLFLVDANVRGAGKGLLCQVIGEIVLGRPMPVSSYSCDTEEMRKRITAVAIAGDAVVLLDNLDGRFGNDALDRALTATRWQDRRLGKSGQVDLPLNAVWLATGNNVLVGADTARRIVHIRLDVLEERPEDRSGFKHPNLLAHVRQSRSQLLRAALTILCAYCHADKPVNGLTPNGSFEGWSGLIREAIVWAGLPDPCAGRERLLLHADSTTDGLASLIDAWAQLDPNAEGLVLSELIARLYPLERLDAPTDAASVQMRAALEQFTGCAPGRTPTARSLGNRLKPHRRRVVGERYLDVNESAARRLGAVWVVRPSTGGAP